MIEQAKLLALTIVLSLLVWAGADSLVNETAFVNVAFEPVPAAAGSNQLIRAASSAPLFEVQLSGPRRSIEALREVSPLIVRLRVPDQPTGAAFVAVDVETVKRQMAEQWPEARRLSIVSIQPPELPVIVDRMVRVEVAVVLNELTRAYAEKPRAQPAAASLRLRESRLQELAGAGSLSPLDLSAEVERLLADKPAGVPVTVLVAMDGRLFGPDAELLPDRVEVTATLQAARTTSDVPAVPIRLAVSFANLQRAYRAVTPDGATLTLVTQTITVTGPTEDVARLLRGDTRAYGIVNLREADLEHLGVVKQIAPEFQLPKGLELARPPEPLEFKLEEVNSPSANGN